MSKIYNQFSDSYNNLFMENMKAFKENMKAFNKKSTSENSKYVVFYPSFGIQKNETCDFLIYGQTPKGWQPEFDISKKNNYAKLLEKAIDFSNSFYENNSPLDWVDVYWCKTAYKEYINSNPKAEEFYEPINYYACQSFFWNVTYKLINKYYGYDENSRNWSKKIVWSNLYKIAPAARENPVDEECDCQLEKSVKLVKKEIEEIRPRYCIVLTNDSWWKEFRNKLKSKRISYKANEYIQSYEQYGSSKIIVTNRSLYGSSSLYVSEILKLIDKNGVEEQ